MVGSVASNAPSTPGTPSAGGGRKLFGYVAMTLTGEPLWQGWLYKPSAKLQARPLCQAVSKVVGRLDEPQQVNFITTGETLACMCACSSPTA